MRGKERYETEKKVYGKRLGVKKHRRKYRIIKEFWGTWGDQTMGRKNLGVGDCGEGRGDSLGIKIHDWKNV